LSQKRLILRDETDHFWDMGRAHTLLHTVVFR